MPSQVTNYQCPACTGPLHFVGESGKLECDYCGSTYEVSEIEALYQKKEEQAAKAHEDASSKDASDKDASDKDASDKDAENPDSWDVSGLSGDWGADAAGMKVYNCPSCGAELICEESTAASSCPYCGNPNVVPGQFSGTLRPDFVLPFKLSKEDAVKALKKYYRGKFFLPRSFTSGNHIQEIKGIYVPFWMFDGEAVGDARYEATRSHTYRSGDYEITETEHYDVYRSGAVAFEKIPVDASSKMPDDYMDSIEPYDYQDLKPFSTAYLPGFLADKYDVTVEECSDRADERAAKTVRDLFYRDASAGYETCISVSENISIQRGKVHYALMPVWLLNTKWNGQDFLFAMNGQTGKMVGDLGKIVTEGAHISAIQLAGIVINETVILISHGRSRKAENHNQGQKHYP